MKEVIAYECEYCGKIYKESSSCKSHHYRCYFNPRTKSCASCAFHNYESRYYKQGHAISYNACLVNIPVGTIGLKTRCKKYLSSFYKEDKDIMDPVFKTYEWEKQFLNVVNIYYQRLKKLENESAHGS